MPIPPELAIACADVAPASAADTVGSCQARYVAAPDSTDEASTLLRAAAALGLTVVPRGAGRLQHWGSPPDSCDLLVDTRRLDRVEHQPENFTVTVQAGVLLYELEEILESGRQHLAIRPPHRAAVGTVGGLIATNAAGSWRYRYGTPRDLLTGITVVRGDGKVIRSGEDVSNVAGQDLVTLFAGSYGTLGLITEATFRLHPLPQVSGGLLVPCADPEDAARLVEMIKDPWIAPSGIDLLWPAGKSIGLFVMIQGDRQSFYERRNRLNELAGRPAQPPIDPASAGRLDAPDHGGLPAAVAQQLLAERERRNAELLDPPADTGTLVSVSFPAAQLAGALTVIRAAAVGSGVAAAIEGSAAVGVLEVKIPAESPPAAVARFVAALRAELSTLSHAGSVSGAPRAVFVYAPDEVRNMTDAHGPVPSLALIRAVKDEFDPELRMAPGRLADAV